MRKQSSHAVSNDDYMMRGNGDALWVEQMLRCLEVLSKLRRAFKDRLAGRIKKKPRLIVLKYFPVRAEIIGQVLPGNRGRNQAMNKQDRNFVGIVRLNHVDACREPWTIRPKE